VDGGVLADRFLDRRRLAFFDPKMRSDETRRYTFLGTTLVVWVSNHAGDYMLDLVNVKVVTRKCRCAQNV
jgi:hypothetical protein